MHSPSMVQTRSWHFPSWYPPPPLAAAVLAAGLLWLSFYPVNWGWVGWFALVPLLTLIRVERVAGTSGRWGVLKPWRYGPIGAAYAGGLIFCLAAFQWIRLASTPMIAIWIGLALAMALQYPIFVWMVRRCERWLRLPLWLTAPLAWTSLEWYRANLHIGFAWYFMGQTQHEQLALIQIADHFGVYGVSFLVVLVNIVLFEALEAILLRRWRLSRLVIGPGVAALAVAGSLWHGHRVLEQTQLKPGPRIAIIQCNLEQDIRNDPNEADTTNRHLYHLLQEAARLRADLIVSPETSLAFWWMRIRPEAGTEQITPKWREEDRQTMAVARRLAEDAGTETLFGMVAVLLEAGGERRCNAAVHLDAQGRELNLYSKMYCLPFGEYIPLEETLPFLKWLSPYDYDYSTTPGMERTIFELKGHPFAVLICYEDTVPHLAPQFMRLSRPPAFFINISNDGWFKGSEEHEQHWVTAKFRAIECRRAMVRSVNMGVSGVIDSVGRTVALPDGVGTLSEAKARKAAFAAEVPIDDRASVFVAWGELWSIGGWILLLGGLLLTVVLERAEARRGTAAAVHPV